MAWETVIGLEARRQFELADDYPLKGLDPLLFTFFDLHMNLNRITGTKIGQVYANIFLLQAFYFFHFTAYLQR